MRVKRFPVSAAAALQPDGAVGESRHTAFNARPMAQDPEVLVYIALSIAFYPADAFLGTVAQSREWYDCYAAAVVRPYGCEVATQEFSVARADGACSN